jgi:hypothetical protein
MSHPKRTEARCCASCSIPFATHPSFSEGDLVRCAAGHTHVPSCLKRTYAHMHQRYTDLGLCCCILRNPPLERCTEPVTFVIDERATLAMCAEYDHCHKLANGSYVFTLCYEHFDDTQRVEGFRTLKERLGIETPVKPTDFAGQLRALAAANTDDRYHETLERRCRKSISP